LDKEIYQMIEAVNEEITNPKPKEEVTTPITSTPPTENANSSIIGYWNKEIEHQYGTEKYPIRYRFQRLFKATGTFWTSLQIGHDEKLNEPDFFQLGTWEIINDELHLHHQKPKRTETYHYEVEFEGAVLNVNASFNIDKNELDQYNEDLMGDWENGGTG